MDRAALLDVARTALADWALDVVRVRLVADGENTTFRVQDRGGDEYNLRVHRPHRHSRDGDPAAPVASELAWLSALRAETDLQVPGPVPTAGGGAVSRVAYAPDDVRVVSLLRWMPGRMRYRSTRPVHLQRLGAVTARLHDHADGWTPPPGFARLRWDAQTFFGNTMVYGDRSAAQCWDLLPPALRRRFEDVADAGRALMSELGEGPDAFGLVHADLHLENALFDGPHVRLIDFDDCGHGYRTYELAVTLWELRHRPGYEALRDALLAGYCGVRPLPAGCSDHLDTFIAVRELAFGLWFVGMAQVKPHFAADLAAVLGGVESSLAALQLL